MIRCRVCGCTEVNACNPPCGWARGMGNLCTSCAEAAATVAQWMDIAVFANMTGLIREAKAIFANEGIMQEPAPRKRGSR